VFKNKTREQKEGKNRSSLKWDALEGYSPVRFFNSDLFLLITTYIPSQRVGLFGIAILRGW